MFKTSFFHGLIAGILASVAGVIYNRIYFFATEIDFTRIINPLSIFGFNIAACLIASIIYWALYKWLGQKGEVLFNFLFSILSFAMVILPISISLPLEIKSPELFPGLAVPMIFFPALAWYTVKPLFKFRDTFL